MRRISGVSQPCDRIAVYAVALVSTLVVSACSQDAGGNASKQPTVDRQTHLVELAVVEVDTLSYSTDRAGLEAGQRVVARGFVGLDDGAPVQPVDENNRGQSDGA